MARRFSRRYEQSSRARSLYLCTPWNPEGSRRCQDELDTRVELCARLVGSINRVVRYISHPTVRSPSIPTLYLRGVAQPRLARLEDTRRRTRNLAGRISTLPEAVRNPRAPPTRSSGERHAVTHCPVNAPPRGGGILRGSFLSCGITADATPRHFARNRATIFR